jgi:hypothetical protein
MEKSFHYCGNNGVIKLQGTLHEKGSNLDYDPAFEKATMFSKTFASA